MNDFELNPVYLLHKIHYGKGEKRKGNNLMAIFRCFIDASCILANFKMRLNY